MEVFKTDNYYCKVVKKQKLRWLRYLQLVYCLPTERTARAALEGKTRSRNRDRPRKK